MAEFIQPSVELLAHTPDPEKLIELAGRVCWKSEDKISDDSSSRFIKMLMVKNHMSVLEHASATFRIITDRAIANEIVRHRTGKFSQESTRYVNYKKRGLEFVVPGGMSCEQMSKFFTACGIAENAYNNMLDAGCKPEVARSVLPLSLKTELVMTMDFRNWLHFIQMRTDKSAHPDVQIVAKMIQEKLREIAPVVFGECDATKQGITTDLT